MERFRKLGISEHVLKSIQEHKFETPSEIQEKSIPLIMEGKDVIAGAATGSGKTLAFAAGIINTVERGKGIQALILTPTRELAEQVSVALQRFSKNKHLEMMSVYGGVSINPQIDKLRTVDVVVGTPGRLLDHINRTTINLTRVKILVLDEADRMLDMGFKDDVERIIDRCPKNRQTLLFSATISSDVSRLARKYMHNPIEVSAEAYVDPSKMTQVYYDVQDNLKFSLLVHLLKNEEAELVMVFCNTQRNTDFVANNLRTLGIEALAIHGGYSQDKRTRTMQKFNEQKFSVLVCTDVAARGLDIKGVSHIYNYDIPKESKDYIHRIGRTARAGEEGKIINILAQRDYENFQRIVSKDEFNLKKIEIPEMERVMVQFRDNRTRSFDRRFSRSDDRRYQSHGNRDGHERQGYGNRPQRSYGEYPRRENKPYQREGRFGGERPQRYGQGSYKPRQREGGYNRDNKGYSTERKHFGRSSGRRDSYRKRY